MILEATTLSSWCLSCLYLQLLALFLPLKDPLKIFTSCSLALFLSLSLSHIHTHTNGENICIQKTLIFHLSSISIPYICLWYFCKYVQIYTQPAHYSFCTFDFWVRTPHVSWLMQVEIVLDCKEKVFWELILVPRKMNSTVSSPIQCLKWLFKMSV